MLLNKSIPKVAICHICMQSAQIVLHDKATAMNVGTCCHAAWKTASHQLDRAVRRPEMFAPILAPNQRFRHPCVGEFTGDNAKHNH